MRSIRTPDTCRTFGFFHAPKRNLRPSQALRKPTLAQLPRGAKVLVEKQEGPAGELRLLRRKVCALNIPGQVSQGNHFPPAKCSPAESHVVVHDHKHVGRTVGRGDFLGEVGRGIPARAADLATAANCEISTGLGIATGWRVLIYRFCRGRNRKSAQGTPGKTETRISCFGGLFRH